MKRVAFAGVLALAACTNPVPQNVSGVREAEAGQVGGCTIVSNIRGLPSVYGPVLGGQGLGYTRNQMFESAREAGANTVVFDKVAPGKEVFELRATAYRC